MTLLERMARNPQGDWTISDVQTVCDQAGISCMPASGGGSHYNLRHPSQPLILTVPARRPIKPYYIRQLVKLARAVQGGT